MIEEEHTINEIQSKLEELMRNRGHILIKSPAFHCECAGCGIEYAWGCTKNHMRRSCEEHASSDKLRLMNVYHWKQ